MFNNRSGAIVPFQSDRHLPVHQPRRNGQQSSGGRGIRSNVVGGANGEFGQNRTLRLKSSLRELSQLPPDR